LRNRIYALCTEPDPLTDRPQPQTCQFGDQLAGNENQVHFYPFDFLALTQTCGLLRAEFRPLWIQANSGAVNLERLSQYLRVFFPSSHSYDTTDRVTIVVFDDMEHDVDVTGFLDLNILAPFVFNFQALRSEEFSTQQFFIERNVRVLNYTLFPFYRRAFPADVARVSLRIAANVTKSAEYGTPTSDGFLRVVYKKEASRVWMDGVTRHAKSCRVWAGDCGKEFSTFSSLICDVVDRAGYNEWYVTASVES
jgi:hypothetical protein